MMPRARPASTAASTVRGPIGRPAARSVRAKCIRLARRWPSADAGCAIARSRRRRRRELGLDLVEEAQRLAALDLGDVVLVFEEDAERVVDRLGRQRQAVELHQPLGPVDLLADPGPLEEVDAAQLLDESHDLAA